jgi:predicted DNA repair protein MutK
VWAVFKGSALNKLIMVPAALFLSAVFPWIITPLLMLGGAFLCYEGFEKVAHRLLHPPEEDRKDHEKRIQALADRQVNMVQFEKQRIRGAIRTDAILSAEIIVIALGTVKDAELAVRIGVVSVIAAVITVGVYGLVAGIVKLDDVGMHLMEKTGESKMVALQNRLGEMILSFAPVLMKTLSVLGTAAMFLVGGGIIAHGLPLLAVWQHDIEDFAHALPVRDRGRRHTRRRAAADQATQAEEGVTSQAADRRIDAQGHALAASVFEAPGSDTVVLVNAATGVPRQFYKYFAAYFPVLQVFRCVLS